MNLSIKFNNKLEEIEAIVTKLRNCMPTGDDNTKELKAALHFII